MPRYLSWNPSRRKVWTEHNSFPKGAIVWRDEHIWPAKLRIYHISEDGSTITEIPESEWEAHSE